MNYTKNHHLPQWEETDRILRDDFNDAMANIETGMSANAQTAAEALKLPYVTGSYEGTGEKNRHFALGFRPSYIIICALLEKTSGETGADHFFAASCGGIVTSQLQLTEEGFTVNCDSRDLFPDLNKSGLIYDYIVFR